MAPAVNAWKYAVPHSPEAERVAHGSLEGVGGLKTNEAYHSKADVLVIPEMYFFFNLPTPFGNFWKCWFCKIRHLFRFVSATGYDTGGIRTIRTVDLGNFVPLFNFSCMFE